MIIDYNDKEQMAKWSFRINREHGRVYISILGEFEGTTFKNFPTIVTENTSFRNCTFEDTQAIEFSQGVVTRCKFQNVSEISGHFANFYDCTFAQCCSQGPFLTIDSFGSVEGCRFETITALGEDGYVIYSVYGGKKAVREIKNCRFVDCEIENEEKELAYCSYLKPFSSYKTKEVDNLDRESCDLGD